MSSERAKGHAKNARNQLKSMQVKARKGELIEESSVEYALDEIKEAIDEIE